MAKGKIARSSFCHYVFKKSSAAKASESVYMRERVNPPFPHTIHLQQTTLKIYIRKDGKSLNINVYLLKNKNIGKHCGKR